jgi:hypothetical protein
MNVSPPKIEMDDWCQVDVGPIMRRRAGLSKRNESLHANPDRAATEKISAVVTRVARFPLSSHTRLPG